MPTTMSRIQDERLTGALALVLAIAGVAYANLATEGENGGTGPFIITAVVLLLLAALVFGRVVPNAADAKPAIWLAAIAAVSCVVFWTGLPMLLGVAAVAAGARAQSTVGTVAAVVGALAAAVGTVGCIIG